MSIVAAWHSAKPETQVYHNNSNCTEQNNIEPYNVREGKGDKRLCAHCERLNRAEGYGVYGLLGGLNARHPLMAMMEPKK